MGYFLKFAYEMRLSPSVPGERKRSSAASCSSLPGYMPKESGGCRWLSVQGESVVQTSVLISQSPVDSHPRGHSLGTGKLSSLTSYYMYLSCVTFPVSEFSTVTFASLSLSLCLSRDEEIIRLQNRRVASETSQLTDESGLSGFRWRVPQAHQSSSFPQKLDSSWLLPLRHFQLT